MMIMKYNTFELFLKTKKPCVQSYERHIQTETDRKKKRMELLYRKMSAIHVEPLH